MRRDVTADTRRGWQLVVEPVRPGALPTTRSGLIAIGNGRHAVVGDLALVNGRYGTAADGIIRPLPAPVWTRTDATTGTDGGPGPGDDRWEVDLRRGLLVRHHDDGRRETRLVSLTRPSIGALRVEAPARRAWCAPLCAPAHEVLAADFEYRTIRSDATSALAETCSDRSRIQLAAEQSAHHDDGVHRLDRIVAVGVSGTYPDAPLTELAAATDLGFDGLLREHTEAWAERWAAADIEIDGDDGIDDDQLALRFALFHLLSCAPTDRHAAAIGARGMTGLAYAGHVFWDTEVFILPTLMATLPAAVHSALAYRLERLPAARRHAAVMGHIGARLPWESADEGDDVTPAVAHTPEGGTVAILTGRAAEHVTADVAWGVVRAAEWTGDRSMIDGPGRALVVETARYWTSRARIAADGSAHLDTVIGPDEYHELVDDNTYTDQMVRWHLLAAADLLDDDDRSGDAARFRDLAGRLPEERSRRGDHHEQFRGFDDLDPSPIADLPDRPIAADVWLGRDRIRLAQIMKQPDVLMLHHLVPDWCPPGWLAADLEHDLPRTAHGSSLSPAICAALLARVGRTDEALHWFDIAARIDLDDLTGTTGEGLHLGTMGGLWQAVVWGFAGIRLVDDRLLVEPHLPDRWRRLVVRLVVRGRRLVATITHDGVAIHLDGTEVPGTSVDLPVRPDPVAAAERSAR